MEADSFFTDYLDPPINGSRLREIDMRAWYDKFAEKGIGYGPSFNGLSDLRAYWGENLATAKVTLRPTMNSAKIGESVYPLHPATLDTCLQLALIACHAGQIDRFQHAFVPILVHDMSIWVPEMQGQEGDLGYGIATGELRGLRGAYARTRLFSASGARILDIKDIRCVAYDGPGNAGFSIGKLPRDPFMRLVWKPDIGSLSSERARTMFSPAYSYATMAPLFENFDRLATYLLVQISMVHQPAIHTDQPKHIQKFLAWVQRCFESAKAGELPFSSEALSASACSRSEVIDRLSMQMSDIIEVQLVKRIYDKLPAIVSNQTSGLQVALQDNLLSKLYASGLGITAAYPQLLQLLDLIVHKNPKMKIIEIGGGTGGATRLTTKTLQGDTCHKRYQDYTFTDVSTSFLSAAEVEFSTCKGMVYKTLDIERNPTEQGYKPTYDLVIASDVLHATASIAQTVRNVRKLLKTGGRMLLIELTRELTGTGILLGTFPDYWNGGEDGRRDSPLFNRDRWNEVLSNNGFSGIDIVLDDYPAPLCAASVILTTAVDSRIMLLTHPSQQERVYIVYRGNPPLFASTLASQLERQNLKPVFVSFDSHIPHKSRIICLIDLEGTTLTHSSQPEMVALKELIYQSSTLIWVSTGGLIQASDPMAAIMVGLFRVIATETPAARLISVDLEPTFDQSSESIARIIIEKETLIQHSTDNLVGESEYVFSDGCLQVSRLIPDKHLNQRFKAQENLDKVTEERTVQSQGPVRATFAHPGLLSSLYFQSDAKFLEPLKDDWVEIKTSAIGLNMKVSVAQSFHS